MGIVEKYLASDLCMRRSDLDLLKTLKELEIKRIIDFHAHYSCEGSLKESDPEIWKNLISTFPYFETNHHERVNKVLYGNDIEIMHVAFPIPMYGWDHKLDNFYLQTLDRKVIWPFLMGVVDDLPYMANEIQSGYWRGVKMYAKQIRPKAKRITDFFSHVILSEINKAGLIIMLHLPNDIIIDWPELSGLMRQYEKINFVLAHFGMSRDCKNRKEELYSIFKKAAKFKNIYFDTAWFFEYDILLRGLEIFGHERVLFATDQPLNLIRCDFFDHPRYGKDRVLTPTDYHWADKNEQAEYRKLYSGNIDEMPMIQTKILSAIFNAAARYSSDRLCLRDIFYNNAYKLLTKF